MSLSPNVAVTVEQIRRRLRRSLPGRSAQACMAPVPRPGWDEEHLQSRGCRIAGVLLLLYPKRSRGGTLHAVLTRRVDYDGTHGGQISLPGGGQEGDEPLESTALRETEEEVGVPEQGIELIGRLTPLYIPPSHYRIYPIVGYRAQEPVFCRDPREVAELIEMPLSRLLEHSARCAEFRSLPQRGRVWIPYFDVGGHKVWGATAMVLAEFAAILESCDS